MKPELGLSFDLSGEAYDFYNLYSWVVGFGIRYGKSRLNDKRTKIMQEILSGCAVRDNALMFIFFFDKRWFLAKWVSVGYLFGEPWCAGEAGGEEQPVMQVQWQDKSVWHAIRSFCSGEPPFPECYTGGCSQNFLGWWAYLQQTRFWTVLTLPGSIYLCLSCVWWCWVVLFDKLCRSKESYGSCNSKVYPHTVHRWCKMALLNHDKMVRTRCKLINSHLTVKENNEEILEASRIEWIMFSVDMMKLGVFQWYISIFL